MSHAQPDPVAVARSLTGALDGVASELKRVNDRVDASERREKALAKYGRVNRILIILAVVGLLLDVTATTVAFVALNGEHHAIAATRANAATVQDIHQANLQGCQANNVRLARQESVLNGILRTPAHASPAARAYLAHARAEIAVGWKARDCAEAYRLSR